MILRAHRPFHAPLYHQSRRFPREQQPTAVIDEILDERVVSSRGQDKPQDVRLKMSGFPLRKRGPLSRRKHDRIPEFIPRCA